MDQIAFLQAKIVSLELQLEKKEHHIKQLEGYHRNLPTPPPSVTEEAVQAGTETPICRECKCRIDQPASTVRKRAPERSGEPKAKRTKKEVFLDALATGNRYPELPYEQGNDVLIANIIGRRVAVQTSRHSDPSLDVIVAGEKYLNLINANEKDARYIERIVYFQDLIFTSYCAVLDHLEYPLEDINKLLNSRISNSKAKNLKRLRNGAVWANEIISDCVSGSLDSGGASSETDRGHWNELINSATEAFLNYGTVATFGTLVEDKKTKPKPQAIETIKRVWLSRLRDLPTPQPLCIPAFIKTIIPGLRIQQICEALGYDAFEVWRFEAIVDEYQDALERVARSQGMPTGRDSTIQAFGGRQQDTSSLSSTLDSEAVGTTIPRGRPQLQYERLDNPSGIANRAPPKPSTVSTSRNCPRQLGSGPISHGGKLYYERRKEPEVLIHSIESTTPMMLPENQRSNENGLDLSIYAQKKDVDLSRFVPPGPGLLDLSVFTDTTTFESFLSSGF